jgi:hypothetical protein
MHEEEKRKKGQEEWKIKKEKMEQKKDKTEWEKESEKDNKEKEERHFPDAWGLKGIAYESGKKMIKLSL